MHYVIPSNTLRLAIVFAVAIAAVASGRTSYAASERSAATSAQSAKDANSDDRIDIIITASIYPANTSPANAKPYTKTTFTNLHVIRVGPAGAANTRGISSSLTVIVTLKQAEDLKFLLDNTNYKFVLKSVKDYDVPDANTVPTTDQSFIQTYHLTH